MKRLGTTLFLLVILTTTAFANDKLALKASIGYARWIPVSGESDYNRGGVCLLGKFLFYNLSPTTSIGIESGFYFWGRAKGESEDGESWEETKTSIPFFLIAHFNIAGNEEELSYYVDLGIGAQSVNRTRIKGNGTGGGVFIGLLATPGIEIYLSPTLKLDIFVEIQYLSLLAFGGGGEATLMMIPSAGIRF